MLSRRQVSLGLLSSLAAPTGVRRAAAQADALAERVGSGLPQLHAIQVQRGAEVVFAAAPRGGGLDRAANIKSCAKSLVALLLGIAISRGEVAGVGARLGDVAPGLIPSDATEGVADLTMEDLVTMRAGLERTSGGNYGAWVSSANWVADALRRPMVAEPGGRMLYSTGTTHVLGAALAVATGESLLAQMRGRLGGPMDFSVPPWTRDPQGRYLGGNQMALTPRAMLALAAMVRDGGRHGGRRVVPEDWIAASRIPRTRSRWSGLGYGYGWFLSDTGYLIARGYGGQIIAAHPEADLAVAITSDPTLPARSDGYFGTLMDLLEGPVLAMA